MYGRWFRIGSRSASARAGAVSTNKGFARRPQEFLEGLYVAIPAFGGEWECGWTAFLAWVECGARGRARARAPNKGFARRPQEFLAWGVGVVPELWGVEWGESRRPQEFLAWGE